MGADIVNIVDGKFSGRSFIHLPAGDWVDLRAEIVRLRGEVAEAAGQVEFLDQQNHQLRLAIAPAEAKTPAPAMPNGVEGLAYAQRLAVAIWSRNYREVSPQWEVCGDLMGVLSQIDNMVSGMSAADNRDAAGVLREAFAKGDAPTTGYEKYWDDTPAAVPAGEAVAVYEGNPCVECGEDTGTGHFPGCCLGTTTQPADGEAVAELVAAANNLRANIGFRIDDPRDAMLQRLHAACASFSSPCNCLGGNKPANLHAPNCPFRTTPPPAPVQAAPQEGEDSHAFKNFHRSLCARFGYTHDENDWRRDLASLEEHIARMATHPAAGDKVRELVEKWRADSDSWYGDDFNRGRQAAALKLADELESALAQPQPQPTYTTGHCENHKKPGGCPMHNLQCGYPECDRKPTQAAHPSACELVAVPSAETLSSALWRDWMTTEQADALGRDMHGWMQAHAALQHRGDSQEVGRG